MDIIQQLANLLSCKTDTIITIITTLTVFVSGVSVNLIIIRINKAVKRLNYRIFFREIIEDIILYTSKQAKEFDRFDKTLKMDNQNNFILNRKIENSLNTFDKIPIEKIYDSFFCGLTINKKKRRKYLRSILNNTQIIKDISFNLSSVIKEMITDFNKHEEVWNKCIDEIRKEYDVLKQQHLAQTINQEHLALFYDFDKMFSDWVSIDDRRNRVIIKEKIIDNIKYNMIIKYKSLQLVIKIENSIIEAISAYENMDAILKLYFEIFSDYKFEFNNYCRKMNKALVLIKARNIYC